MNSECGCKQLDRQLGSVPLSSAAEAAGGEWPNVLSCVTFRYGYDLVRFDRHSYRAKWYGRLLDDPLHSTL